MILIVSHAGDDHAAAVLDVLGRDEHPAVLLDTARFPTEMHLDASIGADEVRMVIEARDGAVVSLDVCRAGWWRRPRPYELHPELDPSAVQWAYQECHEAFAGILASAPASWVNEPYADERASHKPYQLTIAARLGIPFPRTLITTNPERAREFIKTNNDAGTIFKSFRATEEQWRETRLVGKGELERLDELRLAPTIFQQRIDAVSDLRVTVVGNEVFAVEIDKQSDLYPHDYRMSMESAEFRPVQLPEMWVAHLRRLMAELGLVYGAVDLMRLPDGRLVFLEVNPSGEWLFVSDRSGQPITEAMASLLRRFDKEG
ncbi:MvdC/MvdD family ATP grasp protein [Pseudarthrobacter sp. YS3]|uniref:MvdC/MvdD family ATP grasp protein n=1 Tax=Pseudarthrobacter sp. YS3 TaxID=3453718 RepID=UPI003EEFCD37